ncbi:uncharacterized protein LOC132742695 [Ruditapes philippinarum]|uniref:uncharacterized protein LOC132742695 n=1 Tax=Ruditapes philippinarum TaxID=129788 RepID=UPI00295BD2C1|nr:uncharacterized protein LOC132742695 [Ruditapes philippinarum]
MKLLICFVIGVITTVQYGSACTCNPNISIQDKNCRSNFLVLVKVLNNGNVYGMDRVYKINLIATFRSNMQGGVDVRHLYTATDGSACGIILQKGYYYVLTGYYRKSGRRRQMRTGLCDFRNRFRSNPQSVYKPPRCY